MALGGDFAPCLNSNDLCVLVVAVYINVLVLCSVFIAAAEALVALGSTGDRHLGSSGWNVQPYISCMSNERYLYVRANTRFFCNTWPYL